MVMCFLKAGWDVGSIADFGGVVYLKIGQILSPMSDFRSFSQKIFFCRSLPPLYHMGRRFARGGGEKVGKRAVIFGFLSKTLDFAPRV